VITNNVSASYRYIYVIAHIICNHHVYCVSVHVRGPLEKFVNWRQCAAVMEREAVIVMPSCSGGGIVVVA
jgi:hypothetical protein